MQGRIYAVPVSRSFTDTLAQRFGTRYRDDPAGLAKLLFLVPNKRTSVSLKEAFIRFNGRQPMLLPRIVPVGDIEDDDVFFLRADTKTVMQHLPPSIDAFERLFLFTRLIMSRPKTYGLPEMTFGQAFSLAGDLAKLLDTAEQEHLSLADLKNLVPDQYAAHWQETLRFLQIIMSYWPDILRERGVVDPVKRQDTALRTQMNLLKENPPSYGIIAAGVGGATPVLQELLKVIADLPTGEIYLYNLDQQISDEVWFELEETHPQYAHMQLLKFLNISRDRIEDCVSAVNPARERLVSETMRPAFDTWNWLSLRTSPLPQEAVKNLHLCQYADSRQEALSIALILRNTLNTPEKTAALVTTDRALARRVAAELERWAIRIDDSAGKPLHLKPVGIFMRLILNVFEKNMSNAALLSLLKHPLTSLGKDRVVLRAEIRALEKAKRTPSSKESDKVASEEQWKQKSAEFRTFLQPLADLYDQPNVSFKTLLETHIRVAESIAGNDALWRGDDGRSLAALFGRLLPTAAVLGDIDPRQYLNLLTVILSKESVRSNYNSHPRLKILGPIEARFNRFDTVIIGSVNEGTWPEITSGDPWLSRPMKREFGMPLPERNIGINAADFCQFLCAEEVYVTRAARAAGTPMTKSRWLLRLETVLNASGFDLETLSENAYGPLTRLIDKAVTNIRLEPPRPCPPLSMRPRRFSASALERLMSDPYEYYARYILRLKPLDPPDPKPSPIDYGLLVHSVLERMTADSPKALAPDAYEKMLAVGREEFEARKISLEARAFWWPAFTKTAEWFLKQEAAYRETLSETYTEVYGSLTFDAPEGPIILDARADRLDLTKDGTINVVDYKTGQLPTNPRIEAGYAPQLPLEGLIAQRGGFRKQQDETAVKAAETGDLLYWQLGKQVRTVKTNDGALLDKIYTRLTVRLTAFDMPQTPYVSRPAPKYALSHPDYEHLARVKEWTAEEGNDDESSD